MKLISLDDSSPIRLPLWDPRTNRMEETNNRALQLLDQLMDKPGVNIEAFKRVADICDEEDCYFVARDLAASHRAVGSALDM